MFSLQKNLKFITIDQDYLKYLHGFCNEVYYKPTGYESKPYIGILVQENGVEYVIPLSSAKEKHKTWKNVDTDRFLIFENCTTVGSSTKDIYVKKCRRLAEAYSFRDGLEKDDSNKAGTVHRSGF